ncbi:unnamed protein product [Oncorhynchus mykiss]|uniref:SAM domain-containing protein n=1 Tax=Oncorhynchus mykiss TaxID=8022 RepID=A0A060XJ53_ONCMY|nr:unnamed protein product [Oncorhynchus mykiss]
MKSYLLLIKLKLICYVSPEEKAKEIQQKEKKKSIHPAVAALQLFTLFCCGGKVKLRKTRPSQNRQSRKDQDKDNASDTGSDLSGGDVTTKRVKDKSNGKVGREKDRTEVQLLKSSQDHKPRSTTPETDKGTSSGQRPNSINRRTPRQVKTPVEEMYIIPDSPTLPRAHSSLSQFSLARNLAVLPLEWQLPGVPLPTSSMATRTERKPSSTNTSTQAQTETQTTDMNTDTQTTATSQNQISMVSSKTMTEVHTSEPLTQTSTPNMALTPESTKDMITTDDSAKSISETSLKDLIAEDEEDDNELKDMAASATPATDNANEDAKPLELAALYDYILPLSGLQTAQPGSAPDTAHHRVPTTVSLQQERGKEGKRKKIEGIREINSDKVNQQSPVNGETNQERLTRLEGDKESLVLQVSVLTDQVEAQGVKISDLESSLEEHQHKLNSTEEMLQQELLSRTSLESQKLNLMGEVSYLKLKLVDMEEKQFHGVERQHKAEVKLQELRLLKEKVDYLEDQKSQYERRLKATKAELSDLQQLLLSKNAEIDSLHTQLLARPLSTETSERDQELQRLKTGMETLLVANDEKDRRIEELTLLLVQCRQFRDVATPRQAPPTILSISNESTPSSSSEEREHGVVMRTVPSSVLPENKKTEMSFSSSSPQLVSHLPAQKERELWTHSRLLSSSMDNLQNGSSSKHVVVIPVEAEVSTENRPVDNRCQTLPVKASFPEHNGEGECSETQSQRSPEGSEDGDSRKTEKMDDTSSSDLSPQSSGAESGQRTIGSPEHLKNNNSIRKLWGKIRRTQSGGLQGEDLEPNQFRRGGLRATAGPRLTRTPESGSTVRGGIVSFHSLPGQRNPSPSEVIQWSNHRVMEWLRAVDLAEYAPNLRGSGVHGGLIILELRFSSETLAMLLNIPPQKTLLRRHLATAFTALVGTQASLEKREYANATGHAPLTTAAKVRPKKLGFTHFSHLRKRRPDDLGDYICPIDIGGLSAMNGVSHRPYAGVRGLSPILDRVPERREQVGPKS